MLFRRLQLFLLINYLGRNDHLLPTSATFLPLCPHLITDFAAKGKFENINLVSICRYLVYYFTNFWTLMQFFSNCSIHNGNFTKKLLILVSILLGISWKNVAIFTYSYKDFIFTLTVFTHSLTLGWSLPKHQHLFFMSLHLARIKAEHTCNKNKISDDICKFIATLNETIKLGAQFNSVSILKTGR